MTPQKDKRAKDARNAYARQWRAKNRDKVKAAQDRYWDRVAERMENERSELAAQQTEGGKAE